MFCNSVQPAAPSPAPLQWLRDNPDAKEPCLECWDQGSCPKHPKASPALVCTCGYDARNNEREVDFDCIVHYPNRNPLKSPAPSVEQKIAQSKEVSND